MAAPHFSCPQQAFCPLLWNITPPSHIPPQGQFSPSIEQGILALNPIATCLHAIPPPSRTHMSHVFPLYHPNLLLPCSQRVPMRADVSRHVCNVTQCPIVPVFPTVVLASNIFFDDFILSRPKRPFSEICYIFSCCSGCKQYLLGVEQCAGGSGSHVKQLP